MKVVFLDIDGVLNSHRTCLAFGGYPFEVDGKERAMFDEVALSMIRAIVKKADASIVISSSWRITHSWDKIGRALDLPTIDKTPSLCGCRGDEIAHWLAAHPEVDCYVIIDDADDMLEEQRPHFVKTNMTNGFMWEHAEQLAFLLGISIWDSQGARPKVACKPALAWE